MLDIVRCRKYDGIILNFSIVYFVIHIGYEYFIMVRILGADVKIRLSSQLFSVNYWLPDIFA